MMPKHCFEALDKTMRDLLRFQNPLSSKITFGGKTIVFGGDFRQILPLFPKERGKILLGQVLVHRTYGNIVEYFASQKLLDCNIYSKWK